MSQVNYTSSGCVDCDECKYRTETCLCMLSNNEDECPLVERGNDESFNKAF